MGFLGEQGAPGILRAPDDAHHSRGGRIGARIGTAPGRHTSSGLPGAAGGGTLTGEPRTGAQARPEEVVAVNQPWENATLERARAASPLGPLVPLLHALLGAAVREAGLVLVVSDPGGTVLWLDGDARRLAAAERGGVLAGTSWVGSRSCPTALGRALAQRSPARDDLAAAETSPEAPPAAWAAVPVRDPRTGEVPGALGVTGGEHAADPFVLAALRGAAATLESHLATLAARAEEPAPVGPASALTLLRLTGPEAPTLDTPHGTSRLTLRHAEILAVLAAAPRGLDGAELGARVFSDPVTPVTLRAEVTRLRRALAACGALEAGVDLTSRPYRLTGVEVDTSRVMAHLARGAVRPALAEYGGALLPASTAPALVRRRSQVADAVRHAVVESGSAEVLQTYLRLPEAAQDPDLSARATSVQRSRR